MLDIKISDNIYVDKDGFLKCKEAVFEIPEYMNTDIEKPFEFKSFIEKSKDIIKETVKEYLVHEKSMRRTPKFATKIELKDIEFNEPLISQFNPYGMFLDKGATASKPVIKKRRTCQELVFNEKLNRLTLVIGHNDNTYESESVETTDENFVSWEFAYLLLKAKIHMGRTEFHKFVDYVWKRFKRPTRRMFDYLEGVIGQYEGYEQIEEDLKVVKEGKKYFEGKPITLNRLKTTFKFKYDKTKIIK